MNVNRCPACEAAQLTVTTQPEDVEFKGLSVRVGSVLSTVCGNCGYSFATPEQHDANVAAARTAYLEQRAAAKRARGLLSGATLKQMREELGLSQKEAAELFGGGPVAFSKYENEDVTQSVAMDRLVRLVHHMGKFGVQTLREATTKSVTLVTPAQSTGNMSVFASITIESRPLDEVQMSSHAAIGPLVEFPSEVRH